MSTPKQNRTENHTILTRKRTYHEGDIVDFDIVETPLAEQLDLSCRLTRHVSNLCVFVDAQ
jgi:hypothetical protein